MNIIKVNLRPIIRNLNLPTVIKTATLPGSTNESLFIATQVGEIYILRNNELDLFLDISDKVLELGANGGYDERGLLGMAFHPDFIYNGLLYLHYSLRGSQGPGAADGSYKPNPCDPTTLSLTWDNRETQYDHIDTVEEWALQPNGDILPLRRILNLRRPFMNHNGVNSLNFSPETRNLILTTGDGGSGYDPFNLSQDIMEVAGKIVEIQVDRLSQEDSRPVTRFDELPTSIQSTLSLIAIGGRNYTGIQFQENRNYNLKYVGSVGQDLVESIYSYIHYNPIPVVEIVHSSSRDRVLMHRNILNFGWRGWEGDFPTSILQKCDTNSGSPIIQTAFYHEAIDIASQRLQPLTCFYHIDSNPDRFQGTALTAIQPYMGTDIPNLIGSIVFTNFAMPLESKSPARGVLGYTKVNEECIQSEFGLIETDYDFGSESAYYVSLGANRSQTKLYLGVYGSANVADPNLGTIFEIS